MQRHAPRDRRRVTDPLVHRPPASQLPPPLGRAPRVVLGHAHAERPRSSGTCRCSSPTTSARWRSGWSGLVRVVPVVFFSLGQRRRGRRVDRRRLMLLTQTSWRSSPASSPSSPGAASTRCGRVYAITAASAAAGAFDLPARQAITPDLVPREHLPNAISLNTIMFQAAAVAGPAAGGIVIAQLGVAWAYALNAASFRRRDRRAADDAGCWRRAPPRGPAREAAFTMHAALEGLRFVFRAPLIRSTMLLDFFATFFSSATALLPMFAQDILRVGARGYGWLYAAPAVGSILTSAVLVRGVDGIERRGRVLVAAVIGYGVATVAFGLSRNFWLSFACLALTGATDTVSTVLRNLDPPARDAGPPARAHGRRQHGLLHGRPAARRAGGGPRGPMARRGRIGRQRRRPASRPRSRSSRGPRRCGDTVGRRTVTSYRRSGDQEVSF